MAKIALATDDLTKETFNGLKPQKFFPRVLENDLEIGGRQGIAKKMGFW